MAKISRELATTNLHPRETIYATAALAAANAELIIDCDSAGCIGLDIRGTFVGTLEVSGTVDGTNWMLIPIRPVAQTAKVYVATVTTAGLWAAPLLAPYRKARVRMTAYTSGAATVTLSASNALQDQSLDGMVTSQIVTAVGAAAAAVTLTIPAPAAGLRTYITYLAVNRFAAAVLTAAAAPVTITTTNIPGSLAFSFPAEAAALGTIDRWREDFAYPIAVTSQAVNTTIVCPATTGVIWRVTAGFYYGP